MEIIHHPAAANDFDAESPKFDGGMIPAVLKWETGERREEVTCVSRE